MTNRLDPEHTSPIDETTEEPADALDAAAPEADDADGADDPDSPDAADGLDAPDGPDGAADGLDAPDGPDEPADAAGDDAPPEPAVELFVPTAYFQSDERRKKKKKRRKRRRKNVKKRRAVLAIVLGVLIILLALGSSYALRLYRNPGSFFEPASSASAAASPTPKPGQAQLGQATPSPSPTPTASPTLDPYTALEQQADLSLMQNIVNVLIIGVDYAVERETWSGKHDYHADVMMVLAINFDENRVDLISLPRDTYAKIPGIDGIYKLNASINCGGGFEAPGGAGFLKTCESVSWMLGGIPVDYYYAVTMPAVKQLVDAFGGVDYELEISFTMAGRSYTKGPQHMNGQAVLDYLRVRKNVAKSGDQNRINRQKQMMVALFKQMQKKNLLLKIPEILSSFSGQLFTNCTMEQTAALALFAYNLSSEHIGMYSMGGKMTEGIFGWNFVLTDQGNRVKIIEEVYGLDVPRYYEYSATYAHYRWQTMIMDQYVKTTKNMVSQVRDHIGSGELVPDPTPTPTLSPTPSATPDGSTTPATPAPATPAPATPEPPTPEPPTPEPPTPEPPTPTPDEGTGSGNGEGTGNGSGEGTNNAFVVILPGIRIPVETVTQPYSVSQLNAWNEFCAARDELDDARAHADKEAKKYTSGKSNSLADWVDRLTTENSHYRAAALRLAQAFGYSTGKLNWTVNYAKDNEVQVDFR